MPTHRGLPPEIRRPARSCRRSPIPSPTSTRRRSSTRTRTGTRRTSWARARSSSSTTRSASRSRASATRTTTTRACPISTGSSASSRRSRRSGSTRSAADRAAIEFRGLPPSARDELKQGARQQDHGADRATGTAAAPDHAESQEKAVRRCARAPRPGAGDRPVGWRTGAVEDRQRAHRRRHRVSRARRSRPPRRNWRRSPAIWPDIEKSRAEARRLLKEAGAEGLTFELLNRNVDQPYKFIATWVIDQWSKIGLNVTQKVLPTGPFFAAMRSKQLRRDGGLQLPGRGQPGARCRQVPAALGLHRELRQLQDQKEIDLYTEMLHETDPAKLRAGMREFETCVLDTQAHAIVMLVVGPDRAVPVLRARAGRSARATTSTRTWRRSGSTSDRVSAGAARAGGCRRQAHTACASKARR